MTDADENVYDEVNKFKAALHAMYAAKDMDVLFLETATHFRQRRHTFVEAVPMDKEVGMDAPLYYHKAINEAEEWVTHKKIIDTSGKGLRRCVPKVRVGGCCANCVFVCLPSHTTLSFPPPLQNFGYFHVSWQGGGYAHVIEDEESFPRTFGMDVAKGMMGLPPGRFNRGKRTSFDTERRLVLDFLKEWEPFDWTQELDGGEYLPEANTAT